MATIEIITNPVSTIGFFLILLVSVTAMAFIAVLALFGFSTQELLDGES